MISYIPYTRVVNVIKPRGEIPRIESVRRRVSSELAGGHLEFNGDPSHRRDFVPDAIRIFPRYAGYHGRRGSLKLQNREDWGDERVGFRCR